MKTGDFCQLPRWLDRIERVFDRQEEAAEFNLETDQLTIAQRQARHPPKGEWPPKS